MRHSPVARAVALVIGQPDPNPGVPWAVAVAPPGYVLVHPWFPELDESFRPAPTVSDIGRYSPSPEPLTVQKVKDIVAEIPKPAKPGEYTIGDYLASMPPPLTLADLNAAFPAVDVQEGWGSQASQVTMALREYQELHLRLAMERFVRLFEDGTSKAANPP